MATSAVEVDAVPSPDMDAITGVEINATPSIELDAIPLTLDRNTDRPVHKLDPILNKLTTADYISIFFLLIDVKLKKEDFLFLVKKDILYLRNKLLNMYYDFRFRDALLIEIFGTMQKYDLLKFLGTCCHIFDKDKDTFTQLNSLWKFLYAVCEQLTDGEVDYLREKIFPEDTNINVCCAEELICLAFLKGKLEESNWKIKLEDIFKDSHPDYSKFITSYKASNLKYYPLRRPTKTAPCGIAVIMNHVTFDGTSQTRPESNFDATALKKLWESFGFKTETHTDLTAAEVNEVFVKLSMENHSNYDAFVVCYLSHGDEGIVFAKDGKAIVVRELIDLIANRCETLVGKPKLFFVQACQGRGIQTGFGGQVFYPPIQHLTINTQVQASRHSQNVALGSDVLLCNSSIQGYASVRGCDGSWFIRDLVSIMEELGDEITIASILIKVNDSVSKREGDLKNTDITKCKQTPEEINTLKHELRLKKVL